MSSGSTAASSSSSRRRSTSSATTRVLEREPLERSPPPGSSRAFRHAGFWDCMDTYKDAVMLNDLWESGEAAVARLGAEAAGVR